MPLQRQWWQSEDKNEIHKAVWKAILFYDKHQGHIHLANLEHMKLYQNANLKGFAGRDYAAAHTTTHDRGRNVALNVVKSMADTVRAKVATNKPRPVFLTSGADWSVQRKGRKLGKFTEGWFGEADLYKVTSEAFLDAAVFGTGIIMVAEEKNAESTKVIAERVFPDEVIVDDLEGRYGKPPQFHRVRRMDRWQVIEMYPEKEDMLRMTKRVDASTAANHAHNSDQILVVESWHIPSSANSGDGLHSVIVENVTLAWEEWTAPEPPLIFLRWNPRLLGFWGLGLAEELVEIQDEINKLLRRIQQAMHRQAVPRIYVQKGSKVNKGHIRNAIADIVEYVGEPPIDSTPPSMHPEVYAHLDRLYQRAFEIAGVSQLSASSTKPAGLNSGIAIREAQDIETQRFSQIAQEYERFVLDIAAQAIRLVRRVAESEEGFTVRWKGRRFLESIKWSDVDLEEDQYVMQAYPTNFLPSTPAGQLQFVQDLMEIGFLSREESMALLDWPDLESVTSLTRASFDDVMATIETMSDGDWSPPNPFQNLELGKRMILPALNRAKRDKAPEEIQELFRRWLEEAQALIDKQAAATQLGGLPPIATGGPEGAPAGPNGGPPQPGAALPPGLPPAPPQAV